MLPSRYTLSESRSPFRKSSLPSLHQSDRGRTMTISQLACAGSRSDVRDVCGIQFASRTAECLIQHCFPYRCAGCAGKTRDLFVVTIKKVRKAVLDQCPKKATTHVLILQISHSSRTHMLKVKRHAPLRCARSLETSRTDPAHIPHRWLMCGL